MDAETTGIVISSGAVGSLCTLAAAWVKAKWGQKTRIEPNPLPVDGKVEKKQQFVTVGECNRRMCEHTSDIQNLRDEIRSGNNAVLAKLDAMDDKSEGRAVKIHERIGPIAEGLAATAATVEMMKGRK